MQSSPTQENGRGYAIGHARVIQLREPKGRLAQFTVLLLGVRQPLHQALLMDVLDTTTALAREEQRLIGRTLPAAYTACVCFFLVTQIRGYGLRVVKGVVSSARRHVVCMVEEARIEWPCVGRHYVGS